MGEIADALRRARTQRRSEADRPAEPEASVTLRSAFSQAALAQASRSATPVSETWVEAVEPEPGAIVLEEGPNAEVCRQLALRLRTALDERGSRSVAVVSAERGDGKTTLAVNLAIGLATLSREREVALVDLDIRKPSVARLLSISPQAGIEEVLRGGASLAGVCVKVRKPAIDVYPAKTPHRAAHELLVLPTLREIIADLERRYSMVVIDTPPAPLVPDANLVLKHARSCVAIVRAGKTRQRSFRHLLECIPREQLIGEIVNCDRSSDLGKEAYYYDDQPQRSRWRPRWGTAR
jgi:Mrp family chromosome partitioning ATPase